MILDLLWSLRGLEPKRIQLKPIYFNINIKGYVSYPTQKSLIKILDSKRNKFVFSYTLLLPWPLVFGCHSQHQQLLLLHVHADTLHLLLPSALNLIFPEI